jgi:GAF domain-containing protein/ActR/RegA family two-component response regulator
MRMKSLPFPFRNRSLGAGLLFPASLVIAAGSLSFVILRVVTHPVLTPGTLAVPLLIFLAGALGAALGIYYMNVFPLKTFMNELASRQPELAPGKKPVAALSFLAEHAHRMEEDLKDEKNRARALRTRLAALTAVTAVVSQNPDIDQSLSEVLDTILDLTGFEGGMIFLRGGEKNHWDIRAFRGMPLESMWDGALARAGQAILRQVSRQRQLMFVSGSDPDTQRRTQFFRGRGVQTLLAIPLLTKGQVCGATLLVSPQEKEISLNENELLEAIGQQLGLAVSGASSVSEWAAKSRDLSVLVEACSALFGSFDPQSILSTLGERVMRVLGAEFCYTAVLDADGKHLIFQTFSSAREAVPSVKLGQRIRMNQLPLYQKAINTNRMIRIRGEGQLSPPERQLIQSQEAGEVLLIPLGSEERALGLAGLGLAASAEPDAETLALAKSLAGQAASALQKAQAYHDVRQKADELFSLYQMTQKLYSVLNWDQLLDEILKVVVESFGYLNSAILLADMEKRELYVKAAQGFPDERIKDLRIKIGEEGITGWVAQTGEPLVVEDVDQEPRYVKGIMQCKSEIAVPLKLKGEIIGVLDAESDKVSAFGQRDVRVLSLLASQIAVVLENSRLFSQERRKCLQLALINDVARKVVSTLDLNSLLNNVIEAIQLSFKYDHISLFLLDEREGDFVLKACRGSRCESVKLGCRLRKGVGVVGRAAESGKSLLCNQVASDPGYVPAIAETRSELSAPIKKGREVLGVLDLQSFVEDGFDGQDVAVMETITDLLATAVSNSALYEETKAKAYRLELVDQINRAINSTLDVKEIFKVISQELKRVWEYDRISLCFWHPEEQLFRMKMSFCPDTGLSAVGARHISADETNMTVATQTQKPFCQDRLSVDSDSKPMDRLVYSEGIRSYAYVPVLDNRKVVAVLSLESRKKQGLGPDQIELLESIGGHLSVALQNARLFSDLQKAYQNLKSTQKEMIQVERFRAWGEMAGGVVHDFNNILAAILGRVQLLLMKVTSGKHDFREELEKNLRIIEGSAADGDRILNRIREFTRAKSEAEFAPVDLNRLIEDSLELTKAYWRDKAALSGIDIEVHRELKASGLVSGDESELREVVTTLILNALDAMPQGGRLTVKTEDAADSVLLTAADTGVGMSGEVKSQVFSPFFTTKGKQGTGLGLSLAKGIIARHKGEIWVESRPGEGTSFTMRIPRCRREPDDSDSKEVQSRNVSVLVVEDEANIREVLQEILSTAGHQVTLASDGEEGIQLYKKKKPDLVISDLGLPGVSGWEVAASVKEENPSTPVVIFTGWGVKLDQADPKSQNVDRFITKPFNLRQILSLVSELTAGCKSEPLRASERVDAPQSST